MKTKKSVLKVGRTLKSPIVYLARVTQYKKLKPTKPFKPKTQYFHTKGTNKYTRVTYVSNAQGHKRIVSTYVYNNSKEALDRKLTSLYNKFSKTKNDEFAGSSQLISNRSAITNRYTGKVKSGAEVSRSVPFYTVRRKEKSAKTKFENQLEMTLDALERLEEDSLVYDPTEAKRITLEIRKALEKVVPRKKKKVVPRKKKKVKK